MNQSEGEIDASISIDVQESKKQVLKKGKKKPEKRIATLPKDDKVVAVQRKVSRKQRKRAEAESGDRTIAECITSGGNYGIEMAGAKDERKAQINRRKQKAVEKADQIIKKNEKSDAKEQVRQMAPQVAFVNGKMVAQAAQSVSQREIVEQAQNRMLVDDSKTKLSCLNYMSNDPCERWSAADTDKFFAGIQLFGTNFGMIETLFEGKRTRNQIKVSLLHFLNSIQKKFNKEQKKNKAKFD